MEVRGRWWKKAKDIIPNKKADGRFEVCGSANGRPMLVGVYFSFFGHTL
jgi:hypothetical protein